MSEEIWVLITEDGDGEFRAYNGVFATKELAFKYFPKIYARDLKEGESFVLECSRSYDPQYAGGYVTLEDSYDINLKRAGTNPNYRCTVACLEKAELIKE